MIFKTVKFKKVHTGDYNDPDRHTDIYMVEIYWLLFIPIYRRETIMKSNYL